VKDFRIFSRMLSDPNDRGNAIFNRTDLDLRCSFVSTACALSPMWAFSFGHHSLYDPRTECRTRPYPSRHAQYDRFLWVFILRPLSGDFQLVFVLFSGSVADGKPNFIRRIVQTCSWRWPNHAEATLFNGASPFVYALNRFLMSLPRAVNSATRLGFV